MDDSAIKSMAMRDLCEGGGMEFVRARSVNWDPKTWLLLAAPGAKSVEEALRRQEHNSLWASIEKSKPEALGLIREGLGHLWTESASRLAAKAILARGSAPCLEALGLASGKLKEVASEAFWAMTMDPEGVAKSFGRSLSSSKRSYPFWRSEAASAGFEGHPFEKAWLAKRGGSIEAIYSRWEGSGPTPRLRAVFVEAGLWAMELGRPELMGAPDRAVSFAKWLDGSLPMDAGAGISAVAVAEALALRAELPDGKAPKAFSKRM